MKTPVKQALVKQKSPMNENYSLHLDLQQIVTSDTLPNKAAIESWIKTALLEESQNTLHGEYELTVRIVDKDEIQTLNKTYRHQDKPTNILSFPFEAPPQIQLPLLGDLVICHDVVVDEAHQQQKTIAQHWAHIVIHGVLHLKGYDHINDSDAEIMEALEIQILDKLNICNPYQ